MRRLFKLCCVGALLWILSTGVCEAQNLSGPSERKLKEPSKQRLSALELLDKYAQTQDRLRSFRMESALSREIERSKERAVRKSGQWCEARFEGKRISIRLPTWGNVPPKGNYVPI